MRKLLLKKRVILSISLVLVIIDQITKYLAFKYLVGNKIITIIPSLFQLRLAINKGAAFSMFSEYTVILSIVSLIVSIILLALLWRNPTFNNLNGIGIAMLLAGTIGNGIDRWKNSFVIDFLELIPINFPIFNFADLFINLAIIFILLDNIGKKKWS
tara:strand:+ start:179 stop:649 length:471 start_codon:yes stop_codon:yes gene_type:complete